VATLIQDVEPLVADWGSSAEHLRQRVIEVDGLLRTTAPKLRTLTFCTNSARSISPAVDGIGYRSAARKPWAARWARSLPSPIAVAGDTVLTDGLLAVRLHAAFLHVPVRHGQWWPRLQRFMGRLLQPILFIRSVNGS